MAATDIYTYQDAVEHLLDVFENPREGRSLRAARRAVLEAYKELPQLHRWSYYESRFVFYTEASYSTGTIVYDHTGGSSERLITLTGGTFPANAAQYEIQFGDVVYPVGDRVSGTDTEITLRPSLNPGQDVASTTYTMWRRTYPLPLNFTKIYQLYDLENERSVDLVYSDAQHASSIAWYDSPDTPWVATIRNEGEYLNTLSLVFSPPPSARRAYEFMYARAPRELMVELENTGTVGVSAGATSVVGTGGSTAFTSNHVGSIIRFGSPSNAPTNAVGSLDGTGAPHVGQRVITAVGGGSSLTIDASVSTNALSAVLYSISDPIDIENNSMLTLFQRMCEAAYTRITKRDQRDREARERQVSQALVMAKEHDLRTPYMCGYLPYDPFSRLTMQTDAG